MEKTPSVPIITLTTDFGTADHYVGTMKGVLAGLAPEARLIDISHDIAPFSIWSGAYTIGQAWQYFPARTVHVVVVDPGVGTDRKGVVLQAGGQFFVAPDNGVLSFILARDKTAVIHAIENRRYWLESPSSTFHGRDIFAPVGAALACGSATPADVGPPLTGIHILPGLFPEEIHPGHWRGRILSQDRFGNLITNFDTAQFRGSIRHVKIAGLRISRHCGTFAEAARGELFYYFGSSGFIELGMNQQSAALELAVTIGGEAVLEASLA